MHYGIEGLSAFIRTALDCDQRRRTSRELRAMMEEVEEGGWQDAFAALGESAAWLEQTRGPQV